MICKICHINETDSTSGICWECLQKWTLTQKDFYIVVRDGQFMLKKRGREGWRIHKNTLKELLEWYFNKESNSKSNH